MALLDEGLRRAGRLPSPTIDTDVDDGSVKLPLSLQPIGGGIGMLVDADGDPVVGDDGMPILRSMDTPSTGGSAPSYASSQAAQESAQEFQQEQDEAARVFQAEQAEIDRALREREMKLNLARGLAQQAISEKGKAQERAVNVAGQDIFKFLATARGLQAPTGPTPIDIFKQGQLETASQQIPEIGADITDADLASALAKLEAMGQAPDQPTFGFAHGGTMEPGTGSQAVRVGEKGPETLILRPDGSIEVVPEVASAANGLEIGDIGAGFTGLFGRLRQAAGLPQRTATFTPGGTTFVPQRHMGGLGVSQTPHTGAFGAFSQPLTIEQGLSESPAFRTGGGGVTKAGFDLARQVGVLPNPIKIPPAFFRSLLPAEQAALTMAYRFAGVPEEDFAHLNPATGVSGFRGLLTQGARAA